MSLLTSPNITPSGMVQQQPQARPRSKLPIVFGVVALSAVAGFTVWKLAGRPSSTQGPAQPSSSNTAGVAPAVTRKVPVQITPIEADVDVDGVRVQVIDGGVELSGALGTVHAIRVSQGNREVSRSVAITEAGAVPGALVLEPEAQAAASAELPGGKTAKGMVGGGIRPPGHDAGAGKTPTKTGDGLKVDKVFQ